MRFGDIVLSPRGYAVYLAPEDYQYWTSVSQRKNGLLSYLRRQLVYELMQSQGGTNEPVSASDIYLSLKMDDMMQCGSVDIRSSVDKHMDFPDTSPATERKTRTIRPPSSGEA